MLKFSSICSGRRAEVPFESGEYFFHLLGAERPFDTLSSKMENKSDGRRNPLRNERGSSAYMTCA